MSLKVQKTDPFGVTFADPADPGNTVRLKATRSLKSLGGANTTNYVTEIIVGDDVPVTIAGVSTQDTVSVRIRVSGSAESMSRIAELVSGLATILPTWVGEDVLVGFTPTTAPSFPPLV